MRGITNSDILRHSLVFWHRFGTDVFVWQKPITETSQSYIAPLASTFCLSRFRLPWIPMYFLFYLLHKSPVLNMVNLSPDNEHTVIWYQAVQNLSVGGKHTAWIWSQTSSVLSILSHVENAEKEHRFKKTN